MMRTVCFLCLLSFVTSSVNAADKPAPPKVGGRIMYDYAIYDSDDAEFSNGGEVRRARIFIKGKLSGDWFYKLQYDLTGEGRDGIRDAYLGYSGISFLDSIRFGNTIEYGSLEDTTSSKYITFMERSLPILAFAPAPRRLGVAADAHGSAWYAGAGLFGEGAEVDSSEDQGYGVSCRAVWIPKAEERNTIHIGGFAQMRIPPGDDTARFRARPEAHVDGTRLVDTGTISNVNDTVLYGCEALWILGAFSVQGEYMATVVDREDLSSENYSGGYVSASWFLTGESQGYDAPSASLARIRPRRPLGDEGGLGAISLNVRYSSLDLNDSIEGGEQDDLTVGLNWHPTANTRFMLNYVNAEADVAGSETSVNIIQVRTQVDF